MNIYIYSKQHAHGIIVIIENLLKALREKGFNCEHVETLDGRSKQDFIIPYGVMEANEMIDLGYQTKICFAADAITLGYINKIKFYLSLRHIFNYDFFYSIYAYLKYVPKEKKMIDSFMKIILVSPEDIEYFKRKYNPDVHKYECVATGIEPCECVEPIMSDNFRIGILSTWYSPQIVEESNWFIQKYFMRFVKSHPNVHLYIAGRGNRCKIYNKMNNIHVLGEVKSLKDFFSNIDVMISPNPKGCGILNRVLDAFAYRVPVCGHSASFSGFPNSEDCRFSFTDYNSFCDVMRLMMSNRLCMKEKSNNAFNYIMNFNNWTANYKKLVDDISLLLAE